MASAPDRLRALFVYGTLMPGEMRWPALRPYTLSSERATAKGHLWDTRAGYPAARFDPRGREIPGFLVTVAPELLTDVIGMLDRIEGEGALFRRVEVVTSGGPAISYEWLGPTEGLSQLVDGWHGTA